MTPITLPNAITLLRILAVPFFAIAVWYNHLWEALALFVAAEPVHCLNHGAAHFR